VISFPKCDIVGNKKEPSIAIRRIKALFPSIKTVDTSTLALVDKIYNERVAREYASYPKNPSSDAIREALGTEPSFSCDFANDGLTIDKKQAGEVFGKTIYLSQTKIESFVKCKLQYYLKYLLKLKSSAKISFQSKDVGYLAHEVFEKFLVRVKEGNLDFAMITDDDIAKMVDEIIKEYVDKICVSSAQSKRIGHLFKVLRSNMLIFVRSIVDEFAQSEFAPEYFELAFTGRDGNPVPLKFKVGENAKIILSGVADRVDVYRKDGKTYVRVVDYKTGSKKISESDIKRGLNVQMLIYLFTLCNMEDCDFKVKLLGDTSEAVPAGVLYFPMKIGRASSDTEADLTSSDISSLERDIVTENISRNGMLLDDVEILTAQEKELNGRFIPKYTKRAGATFVSYEKFEEHYKTLQAVIDEIGTAMLNGEADAIPLKMGMTLPCEYCEHMAVCRRRLK
jgi:ATP-dependent helicase/nuclease subunit B